MLKFSIFYQDNKIIALLQMVLLFMN